MPNTAEDLDVILLDLHATPATIPPLASLQLMVNLCSVNWHARWQTFEDRDQCATVGFSGRSESKHRGSLWWSVVAGQLSVVRESVSQLF